MKCDSDVDFVENVDDGGDSGIVGEDAQDSDDVAFNAATGVEITYVFPQNSEKRKSFLIFCMRFI